MIDILLPNKTLSIGSTKSTLQELYEILNQNTLKLQWSSLIIEYHTISSK